MKRHVPAAMGRLQSQHGANPRMQGGVCLNGQRGCARSFFKGSAKGTKDCKADDLQGRGGLQMTQRQPVRTELRLLCKCARGNKCGAVQQHKAAHSTHIRLKQLHSRPYKGQLRCRRVRGRTNLPNCRSARLPLGLLPQPCGLPMQTILNAAKT